MAVTPILKPIQNKTGIFYTFQSALEDINLTISNSENDVRFSRFALLRIPEIGTPDTLETDNKIQFNAQGESFMIEGLNVDNNVNLAQSFQSYALNMEALLISRAEYKRDDRLTVSERVFWKWMKELGAIRYTDANNLQKNVVTLGKTKRFVERAETNSTYNKVVKYIADIDATNSIKSNDNSYTEIYIHIPTSVGSTPYVLFESVKDDNYKPGMTVTNNPSNPLNIEYLSGRSFDETHPFGLSIKAYYDLDDQSVFNEITDDPSDLGSLSTGIWFTKTTNNSYYTDDNSGEYDIATEQLIRKQLGPVTTEYVRNTLDGIQIDWNIDNYRLAFENKEIKVFSQFNDYVENKDFEYNAILIYYDVFDPNDLDENGQPNNIKTNLYGIQFLDRIEQDGLEFKIPCNIKYKPDPLNKTNGNAFSHKPNLKLDTSIENVLVEKSVNDYNTFSMELYIDVLTEFRQLQTKYNDELLNLQQLRQEVEGIKDLLVNTEDLNEIKLQIDNIETSLEENSAIFENTDGLVKLIESNSDRINDIVNGETSIEVAYNLDVIRPGAGINIDRRTPNRLLIINNNQDYNIENDSIVNLDEVNIVTLGKYKNYVRHENDNIEVVLDRDFELFINDTDVAWSKGQTMRIIFSDGMDLNIFDLKIYTDALNTQNGGVYGTLIGILNDLDFSPSDNKPMFDITCVDAANLKFKVDKIR